MTIEQLGMTVYVRNSFDTSCVPSLMIYNIYIVYLNINFNKYFFVYFILEHKINLYTIYVYIIVTSNILCTYSRLRIPHGRTRLLKP